MEDRKDWRGIKWKLNAIAVEYNIIDRIDKIEGDIERELDKAREEGKLEVLEELLEWDTQDQEENEPEKVYVDPYEFANPEGAIKVEWKSRDEIMETYKQATQPTPEQKEEWEFDLRNLMYRDGEQLRCAGEGKPYTGEYRELVVSMIKNLLLERERWAIDTFLKDTASYNSFHNGRPRTMRNGLSGEGFEVRVSKLNKKK